MRMGMMRSKVQKSILSLFLKGLNFTSIFASFYLVTQEMKIAHMLRGINKENKIAKPQRVLLRKEITTRRIAS